MPAYVRKQLGGFYGMEWNLWDGIIYQQVKKKENASEHLPS